MTIIYDICLVIAVHRLCKLGIKIVETEGKKKLDINKQNEWTWYLYLVISATFIFSIYVFDCTFAIKKLNSILN